MNIDASFRISHGEFTLDVDFSVPAGGVTAVFGPSGCGKTTLLRAIAGLERRHGGRLAVGHDVWQNGSNALPPHQRPVGYVFQEASLFPHLTVRRNLEYGLKRIPGSRRRVTFNQAVELLGLDAKLDRLPGGLSGGECRRVAIARALLTCPRLLLMDEPLSGLDQQSKNDILPALDRLRKELDIPVFYVSHVLDEVARLADHMVLMEAGAVRATGPISEVLTRVDLPLAHGDDAQAVIEAEVDGYDERYDLTHLRFAGGRFTVARKDVSNGQAVRLRVLARDVSLTLERQSSTSILNIFPATVEKLADDGPAQVMVRLNAGGTPILSRVTRKSVESLGLRPGNELFAQVKSVALLA